MNTENNNTNQESGNASIELAIVLPFLLLMLTGVVQFGTFLTQLDWIANTSYNAALSGARTTSFNRAEEMTSRFTILAEAQSEVSYLTGNTITTSESSGNVTFSLTGPLKKIMGRSPDVRLSITAPVLVRPTTDDSSLNTFSNHGDLYDCTLSVIEQGSGATECDYSAESGSVAGQPYDIFSN